MSYFKRFGDYRHLEHVKTDVDQKCNAYDLGRRFSYRVELLYPVQYVQDYGDISISSGAPRIARSTFQVKARNRLRVALLLLPPLCAILLRGHTHKIENKTYFAINAEKCGNRERPNSHLKLHTLTVGMKYS